MKRHRIFELNDISRAYSTVMESVAKPNGYKFLTPEQAESVAKISPSYMSNTTWGFTSNWLCSAVNRMIKFRKVPFDIAYAAAKDAAKDIADFERLGGKMRVDISTVKSFDELHDIVEKMRASADTNGGLSTKARKDGRARQCYSLLKNGVNSGDIVQTYEDDKYLIGYPNSFEYNSKFSSIGKWCHTGSFGNGQQYWNDYASFPIFYILNKNDGSVLCASWQEQRAEVRDQQDNYPQGFNGRGDSIDAWNTFFTDIGLGEPMVDNIYDTYSKYEVPDDVQSNDVYARVDEFEVSETLFAGLDVSLEGDDYGTIRGNFFFSDSGMKAINPSTNGDDGLITRYSKTPPDGYYTFEEFLEMSRTVWRMTGYDGVTEPIIDTVLDDPRFVRMWNEETRMVPRIWPGRVVDIDDNITMSERFSIPTLKRIVMGEVVDIGPDSVYRCSRIRDIFLQHPIREGLSRRFRDNIRKVFGHCQYGGVDIWDDTLQISIDADEAQSLTDRIRRGELYPGVHPIDILALNLGGKTEFAIERATVSYYDLYILVAYVKYIMKTPVEAEGQMSLDLDG